MLKLLIKKIVWLIRSQVHGPGALLRAATVNVCVSAWVASRIRAPRSRVIWNPVDLSALAPGDKTDTYGCFWFFGRLVPEKGASVLLDALKICRDAGHSLRISVVGDGPERGSLLDQARILGIADAVSFIGSLTGEALRKALAYAWVVVVPTLCEEAMGSSQR